ncbi:MAG: nuclear transport factor 2 family protein [Pseudomonadota bacterium]
MFSVSGTDLNAATALLHLWWGLFEAPAGVDLTPRLDNVFSPAVVVEWRGERYAGRDTVIDLITGMPRELTIAHHLVDLEVKPAGQDTLSMRAALIYQQQDTQGEVVSTRVEHEFVLQPARSGLVFTHISIPEGEPVSRAFVPSAQVNRAKVTVIEFQTHVDRLDGAATGLEALITKDATFHGLMATDQPLSGINGLSSWLAAGPSVFKWVHHNQLLVFDLKPLSENRFEATATFEWLAETVNGERIERRNPVRWTLIETHDKYMRIERIN